MASPSARAPALKYGDVNTETTSPGEVKGLINNKIKEKYSEFYLYLKYYIDKLINLDRKWNENILKKFNYF